MPDKGTGLKSAINDISLDNDYLTLETTMNTHAKKMMIRAVAAAALVASAIGTANAAWLLPNGVWVSNVCRAPSGMVWVYPVAYAQPVGSSCQIYSTGEYGTVY
jgi:hypothetical protein